MLNDVYTYWRDQVAMGCKDVLLFFVMQTIPIFLAEEVVDSTFSHHISQPWKISSLRDTLSNGLILPVCYRVANNVWDTLGVLLQTTRCHPRRTAKELVNWTSTTSPSSTKTTPFCIMRWEFRSRCCQRWTILNSFSSVLLRIATVLLYSTF